jgi:hypothetical protein
MTEYKEEREGDTYDSHCPDDPPANGPVLVSAPFCKRSRSSFCFCLGFGPFRSRFHCIIAIIMSAKIYVGSVVRACVVFSVIRRFFPFFMNGGERGR